MNKLIYRGVGYIPGDINYPKPPVHQAYYVGLPGSQEAT